MLNEILLLVLSALLIEFFLILLHIKKFISVKTEIIASICCIAAIAVVGSIFINARRKPDNNKKTTAESTDRSEENRVMDMIMWYDIDTGPTTNGRPQNGWWPLNPQHPGKVTASGNYRTTTPLMGLYDQRKPETARQHLYWMSALGCNGIAVDWTNYTSYGKTSDAGWHKYVYGVYKNTEVLLNTAQAEKNFKVPGTYITVRLHGSDYEGLKDTMNDVYGLYEKYSDVWYYLDDGTENAEKPFVVIFIDSEIRQELTDGTVIFEDSRFNIRFSNGLLASSTTLEKDGTRSIAGNVPLWLFVENEEDKAAGEGMYRIYHKDDSDGKVEQMIAWASVHKGGENWDEMNNIINGKTTFERTLRGVAEMSPKALLINRFNYAVAWKEEPQEGLSLYASTHIEPNKDFGFLIFDNVKENLYKLNNWNKNAPKAPEVVSDCEDALFLNLSEYPTEYRISLSADDMGEWIYYNVNDGVEISDEMHCKTCFIQTKNTFGESAVAEYAVNSGV